MLTKVTSGRQSFAISLYYLSTVFVYWSRVFLFLSSVFATKHITVCCTFVVCSVVAKHHYVLQGELHMGQLRTKLQSQETTMMLITFIATLMLITFIITLMLITFIITLMLITFIIIIIIRVKRILPQLLFTENCLIASSGTLMETDLRRQ